MEGEEQRSRSVVPKQACFWIVLRVTRTDWLIRVGWPRLCCDKSRETLYRQMQSLQRVDKVAAEPKLKFEECWEWHLLWPPLGVGTAGQASSHDL